MEAEGHENIGGSFKITNLVSSVNLMVGENGYNGEYSKPKGAVIDEIHLDYGDGHVIAEMVDMGELKTSLFEEDITITKAKPKAFIFRDSYFVRPLNEKATVTSGIKLLVQSEADNLSQNTDEPSWYPAFHELIPLYVALEYYRVYPEKYNSRIASDANILESQLISKIESENPTDQRIQTIKEKF
jgi:hypothetical protein